MGIMNSMRNFFFEDEFEEEVETYDRVERMPVERTYVERRYERPEPIHLIGREREVEEEKVQMNKTTYNTGSYKLVVLNPKGFEEAPKLVQSLQAKKPVIVNLESMDTDVARKLFDFLNGATYALNGEVKMVSTNIYIFAPENVCINTGEDDKKGF